MKEYIPMVSHEYTYQGRRYMIRFKVPRKESYPPLHGTRRAELYRLESWKEKPIWRQVQATEASHLIAKILLNEECERLHSVYVDGQ